jgi:hypothetical protein
VPSTGLDIVCELLAVWGEGEARAGGVAEQPGAGGGFELGDLGGESFVPGAEVAGGPGQARVSRGREEPADARLSAGPGEGSPDGWREVIRPAQGGEGVGVAVDAVPDRDAGAAGHGGEVGDRDAGFSRDVLQAPAVYLVLLAQPSRVDLAWTWGWCGVPESCVDQELPDVALAASGDLADLAGAESLAGVDA